MCCNFSVFTVCIIIIIIIIIIVVVVSAAEFALKSTNFSSTLLVILSYKHKCYFLKDI